MSHDHTIGPDQLCIGMYVHLDLPWTSHPFTFSSFKIKSLEQVAAIQALGIQSLRYSPERSDSQPLPAPEVPPEAGSSAPAPDPAALAAKRERLERMAARQATVQACERALLSNSRAVKSITQNLFAKPKQAYEEAGALIGGIADSMLVDADVAIQLMADKVGGEDVYIHSLNVAILSMILGRELKAPPPALKLLGLGALLHDIGKSELPERVARKAGALTAAEQSVFQTHTSKGADMARTMEVAPEVRAIIEQHHEHADGTGYPRKLTGAQMTLLTRIVCLVNAYDNLCNPVDPKRALTPHEALSLIYGQRRAHFDATVLTTFVRSVGIYPPGTVVALNNGTLGMVVSVNSSRPLKPTVLVYDPAVPKEGAIVVDLEQEPDVAVASTLRPQQLPAAVFDYLSPRKRTTYHFSTEGAPG
ncbi:HD-GYP domain-containing protein [Inhella crocodyli]|uniref:HD-GYP domain-containing protein n=1 Tax=Inhella crocodyli TaxID=2499851 RepID=A0A3S2WPJ5_9BURK|nr:HD-GYP domain-containing protein [Inhella crocodyli]RVT84777.1 HD-GYP domain-containing protein [Inhella crocodyli]